MTAPRFHRVIKGFMIQGGDPLTKDLGQGSDVGHGRSRLQDQGRVQRPLRMCAASFPWRARNDPNSAGSQFFICHGDPSFLDHQYTAFGKLIKGDDVLEKIATTPTHPPDRPDKRMDIDQHQDRARRFHQIINLNPNNIMSTNEVAVIKTTAGEMVVEFWPDVAPKTVENFKTLAQARDFTTAPPFIAS